MWLRNLALSFFSINPESINLSQKRWNISCPLDTPLTCGNETSIADQCCFEYPGGIFLQSQFWNYLPRRAGMNQTELEDELGPLESFTIHGLWPDDCHGSYEQFCDSSLFIDDVYYLLKQFGDEGVELLEKLETYWKSNNGNHESLWIHEFNKHGSCIRNIRPECYERWDSGKKETKKYYSRLAVFDYFNITFTLFDKLNTFEILASKNITPSIERQYSKKEIEEALKTAFGDREVFINCDNRNALNEIWYYHLLNGTILNEDFVPIDSTRNIRFSRCKDEGINYYPKGYIPSKGGKPPSKSKTRGIIRPEIISEDNDLNEKGFLIRDGKWMIKGTPANFELIEATFGNYMLKSRNGYCAVDSNSELRCVYKDKKYASQFDLQYNESEKSTYVGYSGQFEWGTSTKPSGRTRKPVFMWKGNSDGSLNVKINLKFVEL
ncbi:hypothetical protein NCAS_0C01400 [Naumovozyma castellii]|uniref:Ribonuclease T2-like n=1 Tax=Naumovozyma castellii TaxID=27288 RepID=G0VCC1_NAUCA|nr:hypothetical protein NCAS_0C01400 [Naumovozyma castellii CBS 4309]CCC69130.1 hypothetical protein NCAS_0C01400 [Naumovozyma castellii CBS 4309]